jgi:S-adenosylmethionine decarboxylase
MPPATDDHSWILELMREAVRNSHAREVHAHVVPFDGSVSPPGFAAVVLIDESHVTAHCYSDRGLLAIDAFTCGKTKPENIIDYLLQSLLAKIPTLQVVNRNHTARFLHDYSIESS